MDFYLHLAVMYKMHVILNGIYVHSDGVCCTIELGVDKHHKTVEGLGTSIPTAYLVCNQLETFLDSDKFDVVYDYIDTIPSIELYLSRFGAEDALIEFFKTIVDGIGGMYIL